MHADIFLAALCLAPGAAGTVHVVHELQRPRRMAMPGAYPAAAHADGIGVVIEYAPGRRHRADRLMGVQSVLGRAEALEVIEAVALVRHHRDQPARLAQQRLAFDQEAEQIRRVLDDVTGNDPVIPVTTADRFGQRFAAPYEVHVLDVVYADARIPVPRAQRRRIGVIQDIHAKAVSVARQRVETWPDLQARSLSGRIARDETLAH